MTKFITVQEQGDGSFVAERLYLTGTYIVGRGKTWKEALGDLLLQATYEFGYDEPPRVVHKDGTLFKFREPKR